MARLVRMTAPHGGTALIPAAAVPHKQANGWRPTDVPEPPDEPAPEPDHTAQEPASPDHTEESY